MKTYRQLTVDELIEVLKKMSDDAPLLGLDADADSYRGYYEHVAIEPLAKGTTAGELRKHLIGRIGTMMQGYKGGEYEFRGDCYVFVAPYGDTGHALAGFTDEGEPITISEGRLY